MLRCSVFENISIYCCHSLIVFTSSLHSWYALTNIYTGGVIDSTHQSLILQLMVICPEDVCKVRFGELTEQSIRTLRILRDAFGIIFKIKASSATAAGSGGGAGAVSGAREYSSSDVTTEDRSTLISCLGVGYKNMARRVT